MNHGKNEDMSIVLVCPSADYISGSILRPINIVYSLNHLKKNVVMKTLPVKEFNDILKWNALRTLLTSKLIVVSGVRPRILALTPLVAFLNKLRGGFVIFDFHGSAWYEAYFLKFHPVFRLVLYILEKFNANVSDVIFVASEPLKLILVEYFRLSEHKIYVVKNAVAAIFERVTAELSSFPREQLRQHILKMLGLNGFRGLILTAPLPTVFASNTEAFEVLRRWVKGLDSESVKVVVTGLKCESSGALVCAGTLSFVDYVTLLMVSDGVVLPYPENAICGGARNKVLEALYLGKPIITTPTGVLFTGLKPHKCYILFNAELTSESLKKVLTSWKPSMDCYKAIRPEEFAISFLSALRNAIHNKNEFSKLAES